MLDLDSYPIDAPCPRCNYELEIPLIDVRLEGRAFCPNCKAMILLRDEGASTEVGMKQIDQAMKDLERTFRKFGG